MAVSPQANATGKIINISTIIDEQPLNRFSLSVFALCFLAMISDGYDLGVIGIGAPTIVKDFGIGREQMSPIFSAALVGLFVGALSSGFIGDRMGRKRGIIGGCLLIGFATFCCGLSHNFTQLLILRFFTGIGLGALYPNTTAMMAEIIPAKHRGAFTAYVFMGITVGGIIPGAVSAAFVGGDWRMMFFIGSAIPFLLVPFLIVFLPESLKLLALKPRRKPELLKWLAKLCPQMHPSADNTYVLNENKQAGLSVAVLFEGNRRLITPILWVNFIAIMLANFFINSYLTIVLRDLGFSTAEASLTASIFYGGGICGGC
jgi:AAHS family 4-hydroxybenzoate transporter-like MFS transporter